MNVLGTWTSKGLPRPSWSNARGDVRMIQFKFMSSFVRDTFNYGLHFANLLCERCRQDI